MPENIITHYKTVYCNIRKTVFYSIIHTYNTARTTANQCEGYRRVKLNLLFIYLGDLV